MRRAGIKSYACESMQYLTEIFFAHWKVRKLRGNYFGFMHPELNYNFYMITPRFYCNLFWLGGAGRINMSICRNQPLQNLCWAQPIIHDVIIFIVSSIASAVPMALVLSYGNHSGTNFFSRLKGNRFLRDISAIQIFPEDVIIRFK